MQKITKWIALALIATGCAGEKPSDPVRTAVEIEPVRTISAVAGTRYSATVEPDVQTTLGFRVGGYVEDVAVEEGDRVAKGAVLAHIRRSDYAERAGQANAQRSQAEAALAQARSEADRARTLFAANALTKPELDAAVARFDMTKAQVSGGRAMAAEAGLSLQDTTLTAPIAGVILRRNIERGDLTGPGAPAFILADTRTVKVVFGVPDTMMRSLHNGQEIGVTTESIPDHRFAGRVARIAPAADPKARNFDIELHIDNPGDELKPGMVASLEISRGAAPTLAVPLAAVIRPPNASQGYAVYVVSNDKVRARIVDLGDPMGNLVAVRGGLRAGEQVVISGPALLVEGQAVRVVPGGSDAQE